MMRSFCEGRREWMQGRDCEKWVIWKAHPRVVVVLWFLLLRYPLWNAMYTTLLVV